MEPFHLQHLGLMDDPARRRILSPMAAQLCHLLLALQPGRGTCQALPNLRENAEKLAQATEDLAAVARRWVCWVFPGQVLGGKERESGKGTGRDGERDGQQN